MVACLLPVLNSGLSLGSLLLCKNKIPVGKKKRIHPKLSGRILRFSALCEAKAPGVLEIVFESEPFLSPGGKKCPVTLAVDF